MYDDAFINLSFSLPNIIFWLEGRERGVGRRREEAREHRGHRDWKWALGFQIVLGLELGAAPYADMIFTLLTRHFFAFSSGALADAAVPRHYLPEVVLFTRCLPPWLTVSWCEPQSADDEWDKISRSLLDFSNFFAPFWKFKILVRYSEIDRIVHLESHHYEI